MCKGVILVNELLENTFLELQDGSRNVTSENNKNY